MTTDAMSRGGFWPAQALGRAVAWMVAIVALVALLVALVQGMQGSEARALAAMEPGRRAEVFQRSRANFETLCHEQSGVGLASDCRQQASVLRQFPECGGDCRAEVGRYLHNWGTR